MATDIIEIKSEQMPPPRPDAPLGETFTRGKIAIPADAIRRFLLQQATPPSSVRFAPTIDPRLKIEKAFNVRFERSGEVMTAYAEEIEEFGQGHTRSEALYDLGKTIAELYFSLEQQAEKLGPDLVALRATLSGHIRRIHS